MAMRIVRSHCVECGMCVSGFNDDKCCPAGAITFDKRPEIDAEKCIECGLCADLCALGAINKISDMELAEQAKGNN